MKRTEPGPVWCGRSSKGVVRERLFPNRLSPLHHPVHLFRRDHPRVRYTTGIGGSQYIESVRSRASDLIGSKRQVRCSAGCNNGKLSSYTGCSNRTVYDSATSTYSPFPPPHT